MTKRAAGVVAAVALTVLVAACGDEDPAGSRPAAAAPPGGLPVATAEAVLAAFDQADSAASSSGDPAGLKGQEVPPSLEVSLAAANRARAAKRTPPAFKHQQPAFAIPAGDAGCFLVTASLQVTGTELALSDVTQFVRQDGGGWKVSHNVTVAQAGAAQARALGGQPAVAGTAALDESRRQQLATEVFGRTTGAADPNLGLLASSNLLDRQFAAGWQVYRQQLGAAGMTAERELKGAEWSQCAAKTDAGVFTFLTLRAADTVAGTAAKPATLSPPSPDLLGLGKAEAVSAPSITIARVQVFLLLVPPTGAATLLGLTDAPTALTTA